VVLFTAGTLHLLFQANKEMTRQTTALKPRIKKWLVRITLFVLLLAVLFIVAVLNPAMFYKRKTIIGNFTIYHSNTLDIALPERLKDAARLLEKSEVYNSTFRLDICLGESTYPKIIGHIFGDAFAWGFYNKVVINGKLDFQNNLHESGWNLSQLLAHEMTHCLQFGKFGLFHSNPLAGYPEWKWEGYPEYIARKEVNESLQHNIERLLQAEQAGVGGWLTLPDSTRTSLWYYKNWLLVKYCLDEKKLTYTQLLKDTAKEENIRRQMMMQHQRIN
jgi:hypothetical protein